MRGILKSNLRRMGVKILSMPLDMIASSTIGLTLFRGARILLDADRAETGMLASQPIQGASDG